MSRKITNELYDMVDNGLISWETLAVACMKYMSEWEVADMASDNEFLIKDDEEEA